MSRFKIGQEVVALDTWSFHGITKGQTYIVDGLACCPGCGLSCLYIKGCTQKTISVCDLNGWPKGCGHREINTRVKFSETRFAPLQSNTEAIEYKLRVSLPELLPIKEVQLT